MNPTWQLQTPIEAIIFDCDGTLSAIEGIDELAKNNGVGEIVSALTAEAMGKSGITPELYQQRLDLVYPQQKQVLELGAQYYTQRTPDADRIIQLFKRLNKSVYLVSAGLYPAVTLFGELLEIPKTHIYAVDIHFDAQGQFLDFDRSSPLLHNDGKREIISQLKNKYQNLLYIGDGLNDFSVHDLVTRFVGYGGVFYRENIKALCEYYLTAPSLAALLPLALTAKEVSLLTPNDQRLYEQGSATLTR